MRFTILLAFIMLAINSFCQTNTQTDSIINAIESGHNSSERLKRYAELFSLTCEKQPEFTIKYGVKILSEEGTKSTTINAEINKSIGYAYSEIEKYDSALFYFTNTLKIYKKRKLVGLEAGLLIEMGKCSFYINQFKNGYDYLQKALEYYIKINSKEDIAKTYQNLGSLYVYSENYEKAEEYYKKALNIYVDINDLDKINDIHINLGSVLHNIKKCDEAIEYYQKSLSIYAEKNDSLNYGIAINNIGLAYEMKEDFTKSIKYYNTAYDIFKKINKKRIESLILYNIATLEYKTGNWDKSIKLFNEVIEIAQKNNLQTIEQGVYDQLTKMYSENNKYKQAFEYLEKAEILNDSISQQEHVQELESLEKLYESKQKEKDIILLTKKNELNKSKIKAQFFANIAFMLIILVIFYTYSLVRRKNANYKKINQEYLKEIEQRKKAENDLLNMAYSLEDKVNQRTRELASSNNQLEREIEHQMLMSIELKKAKNSAEKANRLKTIFLANISHEIRTPLNAILGFSSLLNRPNLTSEKFLKYIHTINKTGKDLLRLINEIIDVSKIEVDEFSIHPEPTNLKHLLIEQLDTFNEIQSNFEKPKISIDYIFDLRDNQNVLLDSTRIKQVLNNLVSNAFKFSNSGCITITSREISKNRFYFSVKDNGIGLSEDKVKYIFEAFRQGQEGHSKEYGGIGVGLSISSKIIKLMGGELQVDSKLGVGSNFYFTVELPEVDICKIENQMTSV